MFKHNETKGQVARIRKNAWPLLLVAALCVATPLHALVPPQYTDNENYKAKGPVKRIVVKTFEAIDKADRVELGEMLDHPVIVDFSANGNQSRVTELNQKGDMLFYFTTEEKDGLPSTQKHYSNKEWMDAYSTYEYKDKKLQSESVYNAEGELFYTEVYTYNKAGKLLNVVRRNPRGEKLQTIEYAYDNAGNCTMERQKGKDDRFVYQKNKSYDAQGRLTGEEHHNQAGTMTSKAEYTYDANGNITNVRRASADGAVTTMRIAYDYDAQKNWTRCTIYAGEYVPTRVVTRVIEYR